MLTCTVLVGTWSAHVAQIPRSAVRSGRVWAERQASQRERLLVLQVQYQYAVATVHSTGIIIYSIPMMNDDDDTILYTYNANV